MINYVMITNLERQEDRFFFALGRLSAVDVPIHGVGVHNPVVRHMAHDGRNYASEEEVREAAIANGFVEFEFTDTGYSYPIGRTRAAWWWTWRCALRHIIELDAVVLLLIDDWMPRPQWTWNRIVGLAGAASRYLEHGGFRIIQLLGSQYSDEVTHSTIIEEAHNCTVIPEGLGYNTVLRKGLAGIANQATILTKEGAALLLDMSMIPPFDSPERDFGKIAARQTDPEYFWGLWHTSEDVVEGVSLGEWAISG